MEKIELPRGIDLHELVETVVNEKVEIDITIEPDRSEITIRPWKPFEYTCPAAVKREG